MSATRLSQVEREYFVTAVGGAAPTEPLNSIKRRHMMETVGSSVGPQTPMNQLEKLWMLSIIGADSNEEWNSVEDLWKEMAISVGEVPSKYINDNKIKFYINA